MTPTLGRNSRLAGTRRGVTLVEMLVTVAVLVIIMTILVQIFQAATGALSAAQTIQQLDNQLKLVDSTIRSDLGGVTARFTPPLDPAQNLGYFEYGENEFADTQGEDSDDYMRFTAKAPPGRPFTGRMWVAASRRNVAGFYNASRPADHGHQRICRDHLLPAQRQPVSPRALDPAAGVSDVHRTHGGQRRVPVLACSGGGPSGNFTPNALGGVTVSWQGVNDISAHPASTGPAGANSNATPSAIQFAGQTVVLNTLGSLTNRENRFAMPRFSDDFYNVVTGAFEPDGYSDDLNGDKVPDFYPSLYPNVFATGLVTAPNYTLSPAAAYLAFPYIYPARIRARRSSRLISTAGFIRRAPMRT